MSHKERPTGVMVNSCLEYTGGTIEFCARRYSEDAENSLIRLGHRLNRGNEA